MSIKIKDLPITERPYEKLELYGTKSLSNAELLAIIIKSGTREETSINLAGRILNLNKNKEKDDLSFLRDISIEEFMQIKGIGKVKAIQLKAICELSIRMSKPSNYKKIQIKEPKDVAELLMNELRYEKREIAKVIILNSKNIILKILDISLGGSNFAIMSPKDILSEAIKMEAPKIILVHNHPSGDPTPSEADFKMTDKVQKAAEIIGIELLDHIVIGDMNYISIFTEKLKIRKNW